MKDRHVLITGATGGLGGAVTRSVLARGARVTVSYRDIERVVALEATLPESARARLHKVEADLLDEEQTARLFGGAERLDALIHLVGGFRMEPLEELTIEAFEAHLRLQLTTTVSCCKHALRRMREGGYGRIVTVGSKAVAQPMASMAAYSAAKAAVVAFTRVVAEETKKSPITANCVLPSIIDTPANRAAMGEAAAASWVTPESLAETITFLASEAAGDLRGAAIEVYGDV